MSGNPFEQSYRIRYFETDRNQELTITSLMRYFEELALFQSEATGVGFDYYNRHHVIWMLHQYDIQIGRIPRFGETILLKTLPHSIYRFMGFRKFWAMDEKGEELVVADSSWLFVNTLTKRPLRVNEDMKKAYGHLDKPESRQEMDAIPALEKLDAEKKFLVRQSDIDVNMHVNHVQYVGWALESLPAEIAEKYRLKRLQVAFKKETVYGTGIKSLVEIHEQGDLLSCRHSIMGDDAQERSALATEWLKV